jgi:hypothetical protein
VTTKTYENENKGFVIDAIAKTFNIDPNKTSTKEQWGWDYLLLEQKSRKYEICQFTEDPQKIIIHLDKYGFEDIGLGKITKESAETIANSIKEKSGTNKKIYIYRITTEGLDEFDGWSEKMLYPEKSFLQKLLRKQV